MVKEFQGMEIPKEKLVLVQKDRNIHDEKLETKPIGYFRDAWNRFKKNKSSIAGACIIAGLLLFSVLVTIFSRYQVKDYDLQYAKALPRSPLFQNAGFWDGARKETLSESLYHYYRAMGAEQPAEGVAGGNRPIKKVYKNYVKGQENSTYYDVRLDSYAKVGYVFLNLSEEEYRAVQEYQNRTNMQILYPVPNKSDVPPIEEQNANYWYKTKTAGNAHAPVLDAEGNYIPIYYTNRKDNYDSLRIGGDDGSYTYGVKNQTGYKVRVLYSNYYEYINGYQANFLFGATGEGKDLLVSVSVGLLFSMLLALGVSAVNMFLGAIYGAVEGYYGGAADLVMERFSDLLNSMPQIVIITLFQMHLASVVGPVPSLLFAFITFGWIGMAANVRTQFYRFKRQEYVLAARTLGASDKRLIFRHIYPNSIGTLITSSVLMIPGVIFTESTLTYLGIVNLGSTNLTSLGTLLSGGQTFLSTFPHIVLFPGLFIALLMISFNLFGNGLRDAFNPSLRGVED